MASGVMSRETGLGMNYGQYFTEDIQKKVNAIRKNEKYECEEAATLSRR